MGLVVSVGTVGESRRMARLVVITGASRFLHQVVNAVDSSQLCRPEPANRSSSSVIMLEVVVVSG